MIKWKCPWAVLISLLLVGCADARPRGAPDNRQQVNITSAPYNATCNGIADDTAAFVAFKAAFQGSTPIQLNLPVGTCMYNAGGGNNFMFRGIANLIVNGQGAANTTLTNTSAGTNLHLGGLGQFQDNLHSERTLTVSAGASCVTLKTAPSITISSIANSIPFSATFTGSISSNILTVTAVAGGTIAAGAYLSAATAALGFSAIQAYGTGGTTGVGGTGTYSVTGSPGSVTSQTIRTFATSFTGTVDNTGVMTVSAIADGALSVGMNVYSENGNINQFAIKSQLTGSAGSTGTYQLDRPPATAFAISSGFLGNGVPRATVNSTSGLTTGDTIYLTGVTGTGVLPQRVNGLRWIKVVDATHIDIFQSDFNGGYTSGGTGGGDRTSLFPVGSKVLMTGWTNQAYWNSPYGYPSNPHWFEYKTVSSVNSGTHQVCFDSVLVNSYKSTWPQYNTGNNFEIDPGGPATLYVLDNTWEMTATFQNFTLDSVLQTYFKGRSATFSNVTMTGSGCAIPSENVTFNWTNVTGTLCNVETDKIVGTWNLTNSTIRRAHVQSSSIDTINISNVTANSWAGSPKRLIATDFTMLCSGCTSDTTLQFGTSNYGASDESSCTNCTMPSTNPSVSRTTPITRVDFTGYQWSMSGGVITIPNAWSWDASAGAQSPGGEIQTRGLVPGHYVLWSGAGGGGARAQVGRVFKVIDVTQDVNNTYVTTSEAGGFPTGAWTTNGLSVVPHPAPMLTTVNLSGDYSATSFNGCTAQSPMYSCQNLTFTGSASGTTPSIFPTIWGEIDTWTFTNNVPYTGGGALSWKLSQFDQFPYLKTDNTQVDTGQTINTKLPSSCGSCTRTLTPSGATNTQVGDSFTTPPAGAVFGGGTSPVFSANTPSDSPQVTITLRTNQHFP